MTRRYLFAVTALCLSFCNIFAQRSEEVRFRVGATISFGMHNIAHNDVGIGGIAGAEKPFSRRFSGEVEASYSYFTGDKAVYPEGDNKAWAIPVLAGIRMYTLDRIYGSLRAGAIFFLLNHESSVHIRPAYGVAAGMNFPRNNNRLNLQLGYNGFRFGGKSRGYTTLAAAIIIN